MCIRLFVIISSTLLIPAIHLLSMMKLPYVPIERTPYWISGDHQSVTTGSAFADIDNDGWLDFVVANGNDIERQGIAVYYNNGDGTFPSFPNWTSKDIDYHCHLSVGDINHDGWNDVAVSVIWGPSGWFDDGKVKVYMNDGNGQLEPFPSWESESTFQTFRCSFGDADGDGDLDLAVAVFNGSSTRSNRIYYNEGGTLDSLPGWLSEEQDLSYDAIWGDVDNDGDLDLACTGNGSLNRVYYNNDGVIETTASWSPSGAYSRSLDASWGDMNGDGWLDLIVGDSYPPQDRCQIYFNDGAGMLETTAGWQSWDGGDNSVVSPIDMDGDSDLDLVVGRLWSEVFIYVSFCHALHVVPLWNSMTTSVIESMTWGDVNRDGIRLIRNESHPANGLKKVFYADHHPIHSLISVSVGDSVVPHDEYCFDLAQGWISLSFAPEADKRVKMTYLFSNSPDLGVGNWDSTEGNYIFLHDPPIPVRVE